MKINVHAGHSLICRGAKAIIDEVTEDRKVKDKVINFLRENGHTVYDCTDDYGKTQSENLNNIVSKCNAHKVDLDVSIHFNACVNDLVGDGKTTGTEVHIFSENGGAKSYAERTCKNISECLGIKNRGVKISPNLYVLRKTNSPAMLIECCFVDDKDDVDRWDVDKCAKAIAEAIMNKTISENKQKLFYRACVEGTWLPVQKSCGTAGTTGKSIPISALKIDYSDHDVYAKAHIQSTGWVDYGKINSNTIIGTMALKRLECLCLKGNFEYRAHVQGTGWTQWTKADGVATVGTVGKGFRIEAIELKEL
jgi:hypothetical protein